MAKALPNAPEAQQNAATGTEEANNGNVGERVDLSVYVITRKQDFDMLPEMVESLPKGIELNIVDTIYDESADNQAAPLLTKEDDHNGRRIRTYEWRYSKWDFASARNAALATCTRTWCLWMDSDDRLPAQYVNDILGLVKQDNPGVGGYMMGCVGYQPPYEDNARGSYYAVPHCRLHRNDPRIKWRGYAHEQIDTSIQDSGYAIAEAAIVIIHVGYVTDTKTLAAKMGRNVMLLCRQLAEDREYIPAYYLQTLRDNLTTYLHMKEHAHG